MSVDPKDPALVERMGEDARLQELSADFLLRSAEYRYSYNFTWLGRPIIQYPGDIVAMQEILWNVRPDAVIETGVAHGGSLIFYASILELLGGEREAIGIDVEIRPHNRTAIESHPMMRRIHLIERSSTDPRTLDEVRRRVAGKRCVVALDSNHTHEHVLAELRLYSELVDAGSYLVVFDTSIDAAPPGFFPDRPWGPGNNPLTAIREFLQENRRFEVDRTIHDKLLITTAREGYLRCIANPS